jgi:aminoglycoside 3-N-acetyltransferase
MKQVRALSRRVPSWLEWSARQVYWRLPQRLLVARSRRRGQPGERPQVGAEEFASELLQRIPANRGPYLVHASLGSFDLLDSAGQPLSGLSASAWLIQRLIQFVGPSGTLCMPTHPQYSDNPGFMFDKSELVLTYDVRRTPSSVGLLSELFRRHPLTQRSEHPLSSMAVRGPLATELLASNAEGDQPLPHGVHSSYYRVCQQKGTVIGLGLSLIKALTILHVAEELRGDDWPVEGFFYSRRFKIIDNQGQTREIQVRERRPEFVRSLVLSQVRRDLLNERILHEYSIGGVKFAVADAAVVLEFMQTQQRNSTYPYLLPGVARLGKPRLGTPKSNLDLAGTQHAG